MRARLRLLSYGVRLSVCLLAILSLQHGQAQTKPQPQPKAPEGGTASVDKGTNQRPATANPDGLKQLEDELFKPLQPFMSENPLERVTTAPVKLPAPRKTPERKRMKEMLERRKNWVFMDPDDLVGIPPPESLEGSEYDRDGVKKEKLSPLEKFLEREEQKRQALSETKKKGAPGEYSPGTDPSVDESEDRSDTGRLRELGGLATTEGSKTNETSITGRSIFSEMGSLTGSGPNLETPQQTLARKARMEEFRHMLGLPGPAFAGPSANAFGGPSSANPLSDPFPRVRDSLRPDSLSGVTDRSSSVNPAPLPGFGGIQATVIPGFAPPDLSPHLSPAPSSLAPVLPPKPELPKSVGSTFSIPKRPF